MGEAVILQIFSMYLLSRLSELAILIGLTPFSSLCLTAIVEFLSIMPGLRITIKSEIGLSNKQFFIVFKGV